MLQNLEYNNSDHRPILMTLEDVSAMASNGPPVLHFEARWPKEDQFRQVVQQAWEQADVGFQKISLAGKLARVHSQLPKWNRSNLEDRKRKIWNKQRIMEEVACSSLTDENVQMQKDLAKEIELLLEQEEIHWAQRSRINWLQHGDKNTSYFHHFASERRKRNSIKRLKNENVTWVEDIESLNPMISDYFARLFTVEVEEPDPEVLSKVDPKVSAAMNEQLLKHTLLMM